ncbi:hypothetical protein KBC04_03820 [Candidatus Babeliales bacterium]|nr:hypothetical protein [Candidatus Babeliales bacterium]MBP9844196.1 hypothetical protein [Candidatus Babeliales bacterium]
MNQENLKYFLLVSLFFTSPELISKVAEVDEKSFVAPVLDDNSGHDKIINIMAQINHSVVPGKVAPIVYTQATNLDKDLNVSEIADFFQAKTVMGKAYLRETLSRPVSPTDKSGIVALRSNIIRQLVENPNLKSEVEAILQSVVPYEKDIITLMSTSFKNKTCPELAQLQQLKDANHPLYGFVKFMNTSRIPKTVEFLELSLALPVLWGATGYCGGVVYKGNYDAIASGLYFGLITAFITFVYADGLVKAGEKRSKMHALNQLIYIAEDLELLSIEENIQTQFKMSLITDNAGVALVDGLKVSRYQNETDYCFDPSAVHTYLYYLYENENQLAQIFASIAEMDACNAIATKMIEAQNSQRQFCFSQVLRSAQPKVISKDFWNVLVPHAVTNSLIQDQHVILTGPNAGGKTTSIRAILQNIVLSQTYGVAAASHFEYTQFDVVLSYLNISDDLINGLSLFASEVKRAQELLEIIKNLPTNQKLFFALDELFTGTAAEAGEKIAYDFIKKIASYHQTLFIYATHFDALKELGKQNIGLMNYKADAPIKNAEGKLVYPFTLSPGASTVNVAMDMAKEANLFN